MLFDQVVQAFSFEPILGEVLKPVVQWMVWQPLHLFSMGEKLFLSSALKRYNSGSLFPSLQLEYFSWLRGLFLDQYFEVFKMHSPSLD